MAPPLVLVDATPLSTRSGLRGIGQMIKNLLHGLAATRANWENELRIAALYDLALTGRYAFSNDLSEAVERAFDKRGTPGGAIVHARRFVLQRAAAAAGARLLHLPEALGTPLRARVPSVVTCHDLIPLVFPKEYLGRWQARWHAVRERHRYTKAARVVCISRRTAADLERLLGVRGDHVDIVPNGIELDRWQARTSDADDRARLAELEVGARPYVVYAGFSDFRKNVEAMLGALALARQKVDVELVWAGELSAKPKRGVTKLMRKHGVEHAVRLLGFVADAHMPALFRSALGHVFLSRLEGFGLSVAEAMAAGCPVIVARDSGADEVAGDAACVVAADDVAAAAAAIVRLSQDPGFAATLRNRGRKRVAAFDVEHMAAGYVAVYRRALLEWGRR